MISFFLAENYVFHSTKDEKEEVDYAASDVSTAVTGANYENIEISTKMKWILQKLKKSKNESVIVFTTWYAISFFIIPI